jgi:hypothetical protein
MSFPAEVSQINPRTGETFQVYEAMFLGYGWCGKAEILVLILDGYFRTNESFARYYVCIFLYT